MTQFHRHFPHIQNRPTTQPLTSLLEYLPPQMSLYTVPTDGVLTLADKQLAAVAAPGTLLVVALFVFRDRVRRVPRVAFLQQQAVH